MKTLEKLEASRKIRPTEFHPKHLSEMKLYGYIGKTGLCINKNITFDLFDSVHFVKNTGVTIHAMGMNGTKATYLILNK